MHILRVHYDSGLRVDFGFEAKRTAAEVHAQLGAVLQKGGGGWHAFSDEHGHAASIRLDGINSIVLTDLVREVQAQVAIQSIVNYGARDMPQPTEPMPARRPAFTG